MKPDDDFLENKSFNQHFLLMLGALFIMILLIASISYAYIWKNWGNTTKVLAGTMAVCILFVFIGGWVFYKFVKLRDIPTHLDIRKDKVRVRYRWGEEVFGTDEVLCYVGSTEKTLFGNRIQGAVLKDGSVVKLEYMDTDFVEDFLALARKKDVPLEKNWAAAKELAN